MLKREITFTNFNDEEVTETHYFNLTKAELIDMELGTEGGFGEGLKRIISAKNIPAIVAEVKKIVLAAYGEKSADGMRFLKSDEIRRAFEQTAAFDALYSELATNHDYAAEFIIGIFPKDLTEGVKAEFEAGKVGILTNDEIKQQLGLSTALPPPPPPAA